MNMDKNNENGKKWLIQYYQHIDNERLASSGKMDKTSDWAIGLVGIVITGVFATIDKISYSQYLPIAGTTLLILFLSNDVRWFRYWDKWMYLLSGIENYMFGMKDIQGIMNEIEKYDLNPIKHGTEIRISKIWAIHRRLHIFYFFPIFFLLVFGLIISFLITKNLNLFMIYFVSILFLFDFEIYGIIWKFQDEINPLKIKIY